MGKETGISWTDATFNPWWGCTKVSTACDNCYAERDSIRYGHAIWGKDSPRRFFTDKHWDGPRKWNAAAAKEGVRRRVFCASMADVMEDRADLQHTRVRLFNLIDDTPNLDWLLLTKRPMNFRRFLPATWQSSPRPNVWLGTTVESPDYLWRIDALKECRAAVHFLSMEPLTAAIPMIGEHLEDIEWVITGGESGPRARPTPPDWFRQIRDASVSHGIPFHFKQNGEWIEFGQSGLVEFPPKQRTVPAKQYMVTDQCEDITLVRIGKKAAGSQLDDVDWKQFPVVSAC